MAAAERPAAPERCGNDVERRYLVIGRTISAAAAWAHANGLRSRDFLPASPRSVRSFDGWRGEEIVFLPDWRVDAGWSWHADRVEAVVQRTVRKRPTTIVRRLAAEVS